MDSTSLHLKSSRSLLNIKHSHARQTQVDKMMNKVALIDSSHKNTYNVSRLSAVLFLNSASILFLWNAYEIYGGRENASIRNSSSLVFVGNLGLFNS